MSGSFDLVSLTPRSTLLNESLPTDSTSQSDDPSATEEMIDSFGKTLSNKLQQVESLQKTAQTKMQKFAAGEIEDVHDVSIAMQKARMGLNVASAVRTKVLEGINELQQMQ